MENKPEFLDSVICKIGNRIAEKISSSNKSEIDKALGVLSNDGVYAYYVYVKSKGMNEIFINEIVELMKYTDIKLKKNSSYENYFVNLSGNLNDLLFFKEMLEETLIYARYHAKARDKNE